MDEKKLEELMNDEEFVKQMATLKTEREVQEAFKSKGLDISVDEIKKLSQEGKKALEDGALEEVSGGGKEDLIPAYIYGIQRLPHTVYNEIKEEGNVPIEQKVGAYAGTATPWVLGAAVCCGLAYKSIKKIAENRLKGKLVAMRFDDQRRL